MADPQRCENCEQPFRPGEQVSGCYPELSHWAPAQCNMRRAEAARETDVDKRETEAERAREQRLAEIEVNLRRLHAAMKHAPTWIIGPNEWRRRDLWSRCETCGEIFNTCTSRYSESMPPLALCPHCRSSCLSSLTGSGARE